MVRLEAKARPLPMLTPSAPELLQWMAPMLPLTPAVRVAVPMKVPLGPPAASVAAAVPVADSLKAYHAARSAGTFVLLRLKSTSLPVPFHVDLMIASIEMPAVTARFAPMPTFTDAAALLSKLSAPLPVSPAIRVVPAARVPVLSPAASAVVVPEASSILHQDTKPAGFTNGALGSGKFLVPGVPPCCQLVVQFAGSSLAALGFTLVRLGPAPSAPAGHLPSLP